MRKPVPNADKAADILVQKGYPAFLDWMAANLQAHQAKLDARKK